MIESEAPDVVRGLVVYQGRLAGAFAVSGGLGRSVSGRAGVESGVRFAIVSSGTAGGVTIGDTVSSGTVGMTGGSGTVSTGSSSGTSTFSPRRLRRMSCARHSVREAWCVGVD